MDKLDLNILPMARHRGQDLTELPGLFIATPPRRPARGRQSDKLILFLSLAGNDPIPADQQKQLLERLGQTYYRTPGSTTAAQRSVAEALNQHLLERNQRNASSGRQGIGLLGIITLRNDSLYLAQSGMMHAFLISADGARHIFEPQIAGRGLGMAKDVQIHYTQASLQANSTLILSPEPPPAWNAAALGSLYGQSVETLRRSLMSQAGQNLNALLLQLKTGAGKTFLLKPKSTQTVSQTFPQPAPEPEPLAQTSLEAQTFAIPQVSYPPESMHAAPEPELRREAVSEISREFEPYPSTLQTPDALKPAEQEPSPAIRQRRGRRTERSRATASSKSAFSRGLARFGLGVGNFFARLLPGEDLFTLPSSVMFFVAVAVPVVVVAIAAGVYFQRGRASQYQAYYAQALQAAGYARLQNEPDQKLAAWQNVLNYLEQAEAHQVTTETQALRAEANRVFDELNLVTRLDYQPALTSQLPDSASITHMFATESELYLFNAEAGNVVRAFVTNNGYQVDSLFQCAAGFPAGQTSQLIDIAPAQINNPNKATVLALDASTNLLQCIPGEPPIFTPLAPPTQGWGKPTAITSDLGSLFVLDAPKNTVWAYWNGQYTTPPEPFFFAEFPLEDIVDLAVDKNDLYLLHQDGHTTLCTYSEISVSPSRCTEPLPYTDSRPGREGQAMEIQPAFSQLVATQPPDPSLYYLQPDARAIYRFSLRLLTYYGQFRPEERAAIGSAISRKPATAFTLRPDGRVAFLSIGNQVLYAAIP